MLQGSSSFRLHDEPLSKALRVKTGYPVVKRELQTGLLRRDYYACRSRTAVQANEIRDMGIFAPSGQNRQHE